MINPAQERSQTGCRTHTGIGLSIDNSPLPGYIEHKSGFIDPLSDIFIKYLLGSEKYKDLLLSFINAVLEDAGLDKIIEVYIRNPFNIKEFTIDKESVVDVKALDEKHRHYNIEIQVNGDDVFRNRSLF